ncbi:MAG: hypothetical protein Ct9H300mP9_4510 [Candidatus Neomarinimicrobiota bacterium]|nr:MAG: hypothetical protein Ct9H300mP9_4510 [Candidatus Neomarinimicrobiota bacterium]
MVKKNPLLEYKSEGFKMFQEMMADMNSVIVQRMFRTQLEGMDQAPQVQGRQVRNIQVQHQDTTGMGFTGQPQRSGQARRDQPQQAVRTPKKGRKKDRKE